MILSVPHFDQAWSHLTSFNSTSSFTSLSILLLPSPLTFALNYRLSVRSNLSSPVIIRWLGCEGEKTITWSNLLIISLPLSPPSFPNAININAPLWSLIFRLFSPLWLVILPVFLSLCPHSYPGLHSFILLRGHDHVRPLYPILSCVSFFLFLLLCQTCSEFLWAAVDMTARGLGWRS